VSRTGPDHDRWGEDVGAYLLEALTDEDLAGFQAHLEVCPTCQEDVASLRVAAAALPASVEQIAPPPELRSRIMAVVNSEAELLAAASGAHADRAPAPVRRRRFGMLSLRPAAALAAVAGLMLVGGVIGSSLDRGDGRDGRGGRPAAERTVVAQVNERFAPGARARLVLHERDSKLTVTGMPVPRGDRVYQVWLKRPGKRAEPTSALFVPRADGTGSVAVPGSLRGVEEVLVTKEPKTGSRRPTTSPIITASPA